MQKNLEGARDAELSLARLKANEQWWNLARGQSYLVMYVCLGPERGLEE